MPESYVHFLRKKPALGWVLYDWANSAFAASVLAGLFPIAFRTLFHGPEDEGLATTRLALINSGVSIIVAVAAPILGAVADKGQRSLLQLLVFAGLGALFTSALALCPAQEWIWAGGCFAIAALSFALGNAAYDALLPRITTQENFHKLSSMGFAAGYLGGGLLLAVQIFWLTKPELFGFQDREQAVRSAFFSVGIWWALFTLPLALWLKEERKKVSLLWAVGSAAKSLKEAAQRLFQGPRSLGLFLLAYFFYIDGVNTIIKMSVDFGLAIGLESKFLLGALLMVQFLSFPSALLFGLLATWWSPRKALLLAIGIYGLVTLGASWIETPTHFFLLAAAIALAQGGVQAISRSLFAQQVPPGEAGEWMGIFNMFGRLAAILGPLLVAGASALWGPRFSLIPLLLLFLVGGALLQWSGRSERKES
jgi:MFS transporter, UMF1 family